MKTLDIAVAPYFLYRYRDNPGSERATRRTTIGWTIPQASRLRHRWRYCFGRRMGNAHPYGGGRELLQRSGRARRPSPTFFPNHAAQKFCGCAVGTSIARPLSCCRFAAIGWTIPQSASQTAPFAQRSLWRGGSLTPARRKTNPVRRTVAPGACYCCVSRRGRRCGHGHRSSARVHRRSW